MRFPKLRRSRRLVLVLLLLVLALFFLMRLTAADPLQAALRAQERILAEPESLHLDEWYAELGRHIDRLPEDDRERVHAARRQWLARQREGRLAAFFALSPAERDRALAAEVASRRRNEEQQAAEQRAAAALPPTATFPAILSGPATDSDATARQVLDERSAEERAMTLEYERLIEEYRRTHR